MGSFSINGLSYNITSETFNKCIWFLDSKFCETPFDFYTLAVK